MIFKTFRDAHLYYNYPSSHRFGTIGDDKGVIRSYSNGKNHDKVIDNGNIIYYMIKNEKIEDLFRLNLKTKRKIRFFLKINDGVKDMGLYLPIRFYKGFIKLTKVK